MSWKEPGGGGPWGGGRGPWGRGSGGPTPPDFDELFRRGQERVRRFMPGGFGRGQGVIWAIVAVIALWVVSGFYTVAPDEVGVVLRFGGFNRITQPGLNYHLPNPVETVNKVPVTRINRIELGYRSLNENVRRTSAETANESLMLTGDQNIVDINFSVFWQIKNPEQYLFDIRDPEGTVKVVAESAMREVIGQLPITAPLYESRTAIAQRTQIRMQELLDQYKAGVSVVQVQLLKADPPAEVIDAFNDVQRAKADQERASNEADQYRNSIVPVARGDAARIIQEATAYKQQVVDLAQGDAQRFLSVLAAYKKAPAVTEQRIYIETLEDVLKNAQKVVIDPQAKGLIPYLPLPELGKGRQPQAPAVSTAAQPPISPTSATGAPK